MAGVRPIRDGPKSMAVPIPTPAVLTAAENQRVAGRQYPWRRRRMLSRISSAQTTVRKGT